MRQRIVFDGCVLELGPVGSRGVRQRSVPRSGVKEQRVTGLADDSDRPRHLLLHRNGQYNMSPNATKRVAEWRCQRGDHDRPYVSSLTELRSMGLSPAVVPAGFGRTCAAPSVLKPAKPAGGPASPVWLPGTRVVLRLQHMTLAVKIGPAITRDERLVVDLPATISRHITKVNERLDPD